MRWVIVPLALVSLTLSIPETTHADAIDRDWCHQGKRLKIDGPDLLTSGGKRMQDLYNRHRFEYKAPAGQE